MHCRSCNYSLWNLRTRTCPECGEAFRPSDFEFNRNSVQFRCPHCMQAYYGTDDRGHIEPPEFDCVKCGRHIHIDEMVLQPGEGLDDQSTTIPPIPWRRREHIGLIKAWLQTIGLAYIQPHRLFANRFMIPAAGPALSFLLITLAVTAAVSILPFIVMFMLVIGFAGTGAGAGVPMGIMLISMMVMLLIFSFLMPLALGLIWALATHGLLRMAGGTPAYGLGRTFEAVAYSAGSYTIAAIPCFGPYIAPLWWPISATVAIKTGQRVSAGRAAFATLALPILAIIVLVGAYAALIATAMAGPAMMQAPVQARQVGQLDAASSTLRLSAAISSAAVREVGGSPRHAAELVTDSSLDPFSFIVQGSRTTMSDVPIGTSTLDVLAASDFTTEQRLISEASAVLPANVIAHRVGDFVFTYHRIPPRLLEERGDELWLVICSLDPDHNELPSVDSSMHVGKADGTVEAFSIERFSERFEAQNVLRASHGLPPLPQPHMITHRSPAMATP